MIKNFRSIFYEMQSSNIGLILKYKFTLTSAIGYIHVVSSFINCLRLINNWALSLIYFSLKKRARYTYDKNFSPQI